MNLSVILAVRPTDSGGARFLCVDREDVGDSLIMENA